jgi:hypothetical protein
VPDAQGHYLLGLRILNMLVTEFNQPTAGRTMTQHRKLAVAFRDGGLLKVFQIAVGAMQLLQGNAAAADDKLREQARTLRSLHAAAPDMSSQVNRRAARSRGRQRVSGGQGWQGVTKRT